MAIPFASARYIQRSKGHSSVKRLAYISRAKIVDKRTGEEFDYTDREPAFEIFALLPDDAPSALYRPTALWNAIETGSKRADAAVGIDLLLSLPTSSQMSETQAAAMVRRFITEAIIKPHGLGATVALHRPHPLEGSDLNFEAGEQEPDDSFARMLKAGDFNIHAHVLVTPRQVDSSGISRRRYTALDVQHGVASTGIDWGRLWGRFQNAFYHELGLDLRVRPNPPVALAQRPLKAVRTKRTALQKRNPELKARDLLVSPAREQINADLVRDTNIALACFDGPFTRGELKDFFQRYFDSTFADELIDEAIGLGDAVTIYPQSASHLHWFAPAGLVQKELACLGRSLILANRRLCPLRHPSVTAGYLRHTANLLRSIAASNDISVVEANGDAATLLADLMSLARESDLIPVAVTNAAGHRTPKGIKRTVASLQRKPASRAVLIVDEPDAMTTNEIDILLQATIAGKNKLILIRRQTSVWPRLQLLDMLANNVEVFAWHKISSQNHLAGQPSIERFEEMEKNGALEFIAPDQIFRFVANALKDENVGVVIFDFQLREACSNFAPEAGWAKRLSGTIEGNSASVLIVLIATETVSALQTLFRASDPRPVTLMVSRSVATSLGELLLAMTDSRMPTAAVAHRAERSRDDDGVFLGPPYFAVTPHGEVRADIASILDAIRFWTFGPVGIEWPKYFRAQKREMLELHVGLQAWLSQRGAEPSLAGEIVVGMSASTKNAHGPSDVYYQQSDKLLPSNEAAGVDDDLDQMSAEAQADRILDDREQTLEDSNEEIDVSEDDDSWENLDPDDLADVSPDDGIDHDD